MEHLNEKHNWFNMTYVVSLDVRNFSNIQEKLKYFINYQIPFEEFVWDAVMLNKKYKLVCLRYKDEILFNIQDKKTNKLLSEQWADEIKTDVYPYLFQRSDGILTYTKYLMKDGFVIDEWSIRDINDNDIIFDNYKMCPISTYQFDGNDYKLCVRIYDIYGNRLNDNVDYELVKTKRMGTTNYEVIDLYDDRYIICLCSDMKEVVYDLREKCEITKHYDSIERCENSKLFECNKNNRIDIIDTKGNIKAENCSSITFFTKKTYKTLHYAVLYKGDDYPYLINSNGVINKKFKFYDIYNYEEMPIPYGYILVLNKENKLNLANIKTGKTVTDDIVDDCWFSEMHTVNSKTSETINFLYKKNNLMRFCTFDLSTGKFKEDITKFIKP